MFERSLLMVLAGTLAAGPVLAQAPVPAPAPAAAPAPPKAPLVVEKRIDMLRAKLKVTPEQTKPFDEFAQIMRDNSIRMEAMLDTQAKAAATMTAVDWLKAYEAVEQARAEDIGREVPAFARLYDTLAADQKKVADDVFREVAAHRKP